MSRMRVGREMHRYRQASWALNTAWAADRCSPSICRRPSLRRRSLLRRSAGAPRPASRLFRLPGFFSDGMDSSQNRFGWFMPKRQDALTRPPPGEDMSFFMRSRRSTHFRCPSLLQPERGFISQVDLKPLGGRRAFIPRGRRRPDPIWDNFHLTALPLRPLPAPPLARDRRPGYQPRPAPKRDGPLETRAHPPTWLPHGSGHP